MLYQALVPFSILLETTETREINAGEGMVFFPEENSKVFLHWMNGEKIRATYTMTKATKVYEKVRLINASNRIIEIKIVDIG